MRSSAPVFRRQMCLRFVCLFRQVGPPVDRATTTVRRLPHSDRDIAASFKRRRATLPSQTRRETYSRKFDLYINQSTRVCEEQKTRENVRPCRYNDEGWIQTRLVRMSQFALGMRAHLRFPLLRYRSVLAP